MSSTPRLEPCWPVYASLEKEAGASSAGDCLALREFGKVAERFLSNAAEQLLTCVECAETQETPSKTPSKP